MVKYMAIKDINEYKGSSINPTDTPSTIYELYSVPSFDNQYPDIIKGSDIGSNKVTVEENDILVCKINPRINRVWVVKHNTENQLLASSEWIIIRSPQNNPNYLKWYFQSPIFRNYINSELTGIGGSLTRAQPKHVALYPVPIPPLEEQKQIAATLDKVTDLIDKRRKQLEKLDELVKARFVEMFGDPILNQKRFPCYTVNDIIEFQGGSQPDKKYFEYEANENNIRLIQIRDYKTDKYLTYIPKSMAKRFCSADDIMIGRYGPPIFQILKGIEGSFNVALMKATPKMGNKEFIRQFLKQDCLLEYLEGLSQRTAGQDGIQMDKLKAYPFPYPPIDLQNQFADFVTQVDKQKSLTKQSLEKLETLKKSLMQEYFG